MHHRDATRKVVVHGAWTGSHLDVGVETIRSWHTKRSFSDIGYHYVIRRDGTIEEGRDPDVQGAHVKGHNDDSIGVCLIGGKPDGDVDIDGSWDFNYTEAQMTALGWLLESLFDRYSDIERVCGHRDLEGVTKDCPGFDVEAYYGSLIRAAIG